MQSETNGHKVRAVVAGGNEIIFSASRDSTVRSWKLQNEWTPDNVFVGHAGFVNALAWIPPSGKNKRGLILSGGQDKLINVFDPVNPDAPLYTLVGHEGNVCALAVEGSDTICSGSWDKSARIWTEFQEIACLKGHDQTVWGVAFADDSVFTAGADKTIKKWRHGKVIATFNGHTDVVRGLVPVDDALYSCSNDGYASNSDGLIRKDN